MRQLEQKFYKPKHTFSHSSASPAALPLILLLLIFSLVRLLSSSSYHARSFCALRSWHFLHSAVDIDIWWMITSNRNNNNNQEHWQQILMFFCLLSLKVLRIAIVVYLVLSPFAQILKWKTSFSFLFSKPFLSFILQSFPSLCLLLAYVRSLGGVLSVSGMQSQHAN